MIYSRRALLCDASILSLIGTASATFSGCKDKTNDPNNDIGNDLTYGTVNPSAHARTRPSVGTRPGPFKSGVRIFFAGSWIFCADATGKGMLAIGRDLASMPHKFTYGPWDDKVGIDSKYKLPENLQSWSGKPYPVKVQGFAAGANTVTDLFQKTVDKNPFLYLINPANDIRIDPSKSGLRIISMPIPARIIPATFRPWAFVNFNSNVPVATPGHYPAMGVATTHIFEYPGAQGLTFDSPAGQLSISQPATDFAADFHFHVLPETSDHTDHGPEMFANILELVSSHSGVFSPSDLSLITPSTPHQSLDLFAGPDVPANPCVTDNELGLGIVHIDLASCTGGIIGIGG